MPNEKWSCPFCRSRVVLSQEEIGLLKLFVQMVEERVEIPLETCRSVKGLLEIRDDDQRSNSER